MRRVGVTFDTSAHLEKLRTGFLVIRIDFCMKILAGDLTPLSPEPETLPVSMAAAVIGGLYEKKWTVEYKMPESFSSPINLWIPFIFGSPVFFLLSKMEVPKPWSFCPSSLIEERSWPMSDTRFEEPSHIQKPKRLGETWQYSPKPNKLQSAPGSYINIWISVILHY